MFLRKPLLFRVLLTLMVPLFACGFIIPGLSMTYIKSIHFLVPYLKHQLTINEPFSF